MTATAELITALVAGGMSAAEAAGLVARAAVEMTGALTAKKAPKAGALRMSDYRDRREAMGMPRIFPANQYRPLLLERDGERCIYCEATGPLVIDHIHPTFLGGNDDLGNLGLACRPCNGRKAGKPLQAAGMCIVVESAASAHKGYLERTQCAQEQSTVNAHNPRTDTHISAQAESANGAQDVRQSAHKSAHTPEAPISLSSSNSLSERKESKEVRKKDIARKKSLRPLSDDWVPSLRSYQIAEEHGQNVQVVEQIFRDYLKSSGKLYADYDAAFNNFLRNQHRFSGSRPHEKPAPRSGGSLIAALDRKLEELAAENGADRALPKSDLLSLSDGSVRRS